MTARSDSTAPSESADRDAVARTLRTEQLDRVYGQAARNQVLSPVAGALVCGATWTRVDHDLLLAFLGALLAASLGRQALAKAYHGCHPERRGSLAWARAFTASAALVGAIWGIGLAWMMHDAAGTLDGYLYAFAVGMAGGTAVVYAAHGRAVAWTIGCMLGPVTAVLIVRADALHFGMAAGGVLFAAGAWRGVRTMSAAMSRALQLSSELERQARTDALSGLANRRALTEAGDAMLAHALRTRRACAALMIDIDHFKRINDSLGHAAGDTVIAALGALLRATVRSDEQAGRIGGEEFAVLLPDADAAQAKALAERLLAAVRAMRVPHVDGPIRITVSIGVAVTGHPAGSLQRLLGRADDALYAAKHGGRDRLEMADAAGPPSPPAPPPDGH